MGVSWASFSTSVTRNQFSPLSIWAAAKGLCVMLDGLDKRLHPVRRRFNRQVSGVGCHDYSYLTFLHVPKQSGKRLTALAEPLVIREVPHFAVVLCRINGRLAVVCHVL